MQSKYPALIFLSILEKSDVFIWSSKLIRITYKVIILFCIMNRQDNICVMRVNCKRETQSFLLHGRSSLFIRANCTIVRRRIGGRVSQDWKMFFKVGIKRS
jgi:hypothetical protein